MLNLILIVCIISASLTFVSTVSAHVLQNEEIGEDCYFKVWTNTREGIELSYEVELVSGTRVDVYFLNVSEAEHYMNNQEFQESLMHEKVTSVQGVFKVPDNEDYYFFVDNLDNTHESDAIPTGDVVVNVELESSMIRNNQSNIQISPMYALMGGIIFFGLLGIMLNLQKRKYPNHKNQYRAKSNMPFFLQKQSSSKPSSRQSSTIFSSPTVNLHSIKEKLPLINAGRLTNKFNDTSQLNGFDSKPPPMN